MISVKVPATTANIGPGFDCMGMALSIYNGVRVQEGSTGGNLTIHGSDGIPKNEDNLIYKTIADFFREAGKPIPPLTLWQEDNIPMTRGLGSSAACVVAGLLAGNELAKTGLTRAEIINMAAKIEGHPDNSTPALTGGLIIGAMGSGGLEYIQIPKENWAGLRMALMVPAFELATEKARKALPAEYSRADMVHNASRTALLTAAFFSGDFEKLAVALDDRVHQPYRLPLVPGMGSIFEEARNRGAYSAFLSGAGPALIAFAEREDFLPKMEIFLKTLPQHWDITWVAPDHTGATIELI